MKNILIIGEYSAFAKNLCEGINQISGYHAVVFAYKDGFKNISQSSDSHTYDNATRYKICGFPIPFSEKIKGFKLYRQFKTDIIPFKSSFDIVFIINSSFIRSEKCHTLPLFSIDDIKYVTKPNSKVFLSACGGDSVYYQFATTDKRISTTFNVKNSHVSKRVKQSEDLVYPLVNGIIPMSYQYAQAYRMYAKHLNIIPSVHLPFDLSTIPERKSYLENGKVVIFNAALRPKKGIVYINEALEIIKHKYADRIIIKDVRLPYDEYLRFLPTVDLFIDLCVDYDYGMSAISAMAAGCVVFSGNEPETQRELGHYDVPVVGISPSVQDIVDKLEHFILNPKLIEQVGRESIAYAQKYHNCKTIAESYLEVFNRN